MTLETVSTAIDVQFCVTARPGPVPVESPLGAIGLFGSLCQWNTQTRKVECGDIEWISMETLLRGQQSNPEIQQMYRDCRNTFSSRWDFWLLVVRASGTRRANHDEAQIRMTWQILNEPETIKYSQWAWKAATQLPDPEARKFFQILSMYHLMVGQRHNADTMQLYRACFRYDAEELFRRVELVVPLDLEEVLIELERGRGGGAGA